MLLAKIGIFLLVLFPLCSCASPEPEVDTHRLTDSPNRGPQPGLEARSFPSPLSQAFIRDSDRELSDALFASKWRDSLVSPLMFFRAFPGAYHRDLGLVASLEIPGRETLCFGDAHPNNFGFLHLGKRTLFAFNDLDDSGLCPLLVDALRYFTAVRLNWNDKDLIKDLLDQYLKAVQNHGAPISIDANQFPDWKAVEEQQIKRNVENQLFIPKPHQVRVSHDELRAIQTLVGTVPEFAGFQLLDAISIERDFGGSGGLKRYRLLMRTIDDQLRIIEWKEAGLPGTNQGRQSQAIPMDERLSLIKKSFWDSKEADDYFYITYAETRYLVRNRMNMSSIDLSALDATEVKSVLLAQVSYMAQVHAKAWGNLDNSEIRHWLTESIKTVADRWETLYHAFHP